MPPVTGRFGPCEFQSVVDVTWSATPQRSVRAEVSIDARTRGYEISFLVPADTTTQRTVTTVTNACGDPNPSVPTSSDDPIEWEPWRFVIRCPATFPQDADNRIVCDPVRHQKDRKLLGSVSRRSQGQTDADERQTWLNDSPIRAQRA